MCWASRAHLHQHGHTCACVADHPRAPHLPESVGVQGENGGIPFKGLLNGIGSLRERVELIARVDLSAGCFCQLSGLHRLRIAKVGRN